MTVIRVPAAGGRGGRRRRLPSVMENAAEPPADADRGDAAETLQRVALDLFARQNYATVTIKDIAAATGFNPSLIYYYFGSKEGLFLKAIERTVDEAFLYFAAISDRTNDPVKIISFWIEVHVQRYAQLQKLAKISLDYASTLERTDPADEAIRRFYDREAMVLGKAIKDGMASGQFRPGNAKAAALFISTFLDGSLFRKVLFPEFDARKAIRHMRKVILTYLRTGEVEPVADGPAPLSMLAD